MTIALVTRYAISKRSSILVKSIDNLGKLGETLLQVDEVGVSCD